jgi:hypothetical protein
MDPTRLLEDELDEFERALLRSARVDEPDARAIARAAVALSVGTSALTVAAGSAAAAATASAAPGAGTAIGTFSKLGTLAVVKWLSIGVVGGLVTTSGVEIARTAIVFSPDEPAAAVAPSRPIAMTASARQASDLSPVPVPPAPADTADKAPAPPTVAFSDVGFDSPPAAARAATPKVARSGADALPAGAPAAAAARGAAAPVSIATPTAAFRNPVAHSAAETPKVVSIAEETAMLDRARRALASGNAATALTELESYDQRARARALSTEAAVLRVEALLQAGQRASAVELAQRLLALQPNGPHANRLRSVVASSPYILNGSSRETRAR